MRDRHLSSDPDDAGLHVAHEADRTSPASVRLAHYREPVVAIRLTSRPAHSTWREWAGAFSPGRLLAAAALTPLLFGAYRGAIEGVPPTGPGWTALLLAIAAIGSLALATYLPQRRVARASSSCAAVAGVWVLLAGLALTGPADPLNGLLALGAVSFALLQRLRGSRACGTSGAA